MQGDLGGRRRAETARLAYGIEPPEYRLPQATRVGGVRLQVSDLPRSLEYYQQMIGLRVLHENGASASLAAQSSDRPLVTLETRPGVKPARRGAFGLYHFAILLPDRAALGRFAAHLAARGARAGMADHLVSEAFYLWDPDGLGIEVYADRPRELWQRHGRELAMATDPLDAQDVIAAARGEPWQAAPAGTTMGHVHLHVGDLAAAEEFYHRALGFDKTVWSYAGALFLSAGGYHHHLGTNVWSPGPQPAPDEARLLDWELIVPAQADVRDAAESLRAAGHVNQGEDGAGGMLAADPWGTRVRLRAIS